MSLKKTWFSDVLWFVFVVPSVFITYCILTVVLQDFYAMLSSYAPGYEFYMDLGAKAVTILLVALIVVLLRLVFSRIKILHIPKWLGITGHILLCVTIIAGFCALRYSSFYYALNLQSFSKAPSEQIMYFYELSKVGSVTGANISVGTVSFMEQAYISVMRTVFLFFGNKIEVLLFVQLILQVLSFVLLIIVGWTLQKGIYAWIPALLYAVTPSFFYTASDSGVTNFWTFIVVFCLFIVCMLEKAWKKKNITYLVMVLLQVIFAACVFLAKMGVLIYGGNPFISGGATPGAVFVLNAEMIVLSVFLITYCLTFFMDTQDHSSLFILPVIGYGFLSVWLSNYEFEMSYCLMLLAMINLLFMISQSVRTLFMAKPEVITGKTNSVDMANAVDTGNVVDNKFEWEEMQEVMHSTEGIEVRNEEPVKVELPITEISVEEKEIVVPIDKKAPIENVLPMPKKHKSRVLDYAFEPTEDMMHYDVEFENDDYDY